MEMLQRSLSVQHTVFHPFFDLGVLPRQDELVPLEADMYILLRHLDGKLKGRNN